MMRLIAVLTMAILTLPFNASTKIVTVYTRDQ